MFLNPEYDQEYWDRHPIQHIVLLSLVFPVFTAGLAYFGFDPITNGRVLLLGILGVVFLIAFYKLRKTKGIHRVIMVIVLLIMMSICVYAYLLGRAAPLGTGTSIDEAVVHMLTNQQSVSLCASWQGDLRSVRSGSSSNRDRSFPPDPGTPLCSRGDAFWESLPEGWQYDRIKDKHGSNGTLTFSAHNRNGDRITCTEKECTLRDRSGTKTVLSK